MDFDWDEHAGGWDDDPDVRDYAARAHTCLAETTDLRGLRVFDFGCGTGLLTEKIAVDAAAVVALDPAQRMIDALARKAVPDVTPITAEFSPELIAQHPAFEAPFDLVTASSVCAFVPDYPATLALLRTVIAPDGWFVQWDWRADGADDGFGFTEDHLRNAIALAGFVDIAISEPFSISRDSDGDMPVLMAVARNPRT